MKKSLLLLAFSGSTILAAQAQTTIGRGTGLLSGSVGYHADTNDVTSTSGGTGSGATSTVTYSTFKLDIAIGGFVATNLAVGVQLSHAVTGGSAKSSVNPRVVAPTTYSTLRVGPLVQYYKMLGEQFGLTATLGAGYESDVVPPRYSGYYATVKQTGVYGALTPGIVFFPVPKFGLTATIGSLAYTRLKVKDTGLSDEINSSFDAGFGFSQLQFGAAYYFGRK